MRRAVHLVTAEEAVRAAVARGLPACDLLIVYPRAASVGLSALRAATHLVLDLGVADGHGIGEHLLATLPELRLSVLRNARALDILPRTETDHGRSARCARTMHTGHASSPSRFDSLLSS